MDYRKAYIMAIRDEVPPLERGYWQAVGAMVGTAAESLAAKYGRTRAEALADIAAWAEVESDEGGDAPCE